MCIRDSHASVLVVLVGDFVPTVDHAGELVALVVLHHQRGCLLYTSPQSAPARRHRPSWRKSRWRMWLFRISPGSIPAVSYTHLDVYKRQALCRMPSCVAVASKGGQVALAMGKAIGERKAVIGLDTLHGNAFAGKMLEMCIRDRPALCRRGGVRDAGDDRPSGM